MVSHTLVYEKLKNAKYSAMQLTSSMTPQLCTIKVDGTLAAQKRSTIA